jgi:hypothetical protein
MSKIIRLDEDVYSALKTRASMEGKTLSKAVDTLMHTADDHAGTEKRLASLELKIEELSQLFLKKQATLTQKPKKERPSRDLNPSRSLDRAP